MTKELIDTSN